MEPDREQHVSLEGLITGIWAAELDAETPKECALELGNLKFIRHGLSLAALARAHGSPARNRGPGVMMGT